MKIKIQKLKSDAELPEYRTIGSSGADLKALPESDVIIEPGMTALIPTGIAVEIPEGYEIQIRTRSGLAANSGIIVLNSPGTIDSDYRGEIRIIIANLGKKPFTVKKGDRIAQAVIARSYRAEFEETQSLSTSIRASRGFGSTGI